MTSAYHHPRILELLKKVKDMGTIAEAMFRTIQEVIEPSAHVVTVYYQLDYSEMAGEGGGPEFYSCELAVLTTRHLAQFGFFPNFHRVRLVPVEALQELALENIFATGFEDDRPDPAQQGFQPQQIKATFTFKAPTPKQVEVWEVEASRPENVQQLREIYHALARTVGVPLSHFAGEG